VVGAIAGLLLGGCLPATVTDEGRRVADLYTVFMAAAAVVFVIVAGLISWVVVRDRARGATDLPAQTHANARLELGWWALPTLVVIGLFVATASVLARVDASAPDDALTVEVNAFQWGWRFTLPDEGVIVVGDANEPPRLVLPVDRPVQFVLTSPDVVHSFFVPEFLVKRDNVPGQDNRLTVTVRQQGIYAGQCGEFCGLLHERMTFELEAVSAERFEAWLAEHGADQ
jgi:cytochrome c oxidase subunit 2